MLYGSNSCMSYMQLVLRHTCELHILIWNHLAHLLEWLYDTTIMKPGFESQLYWIWDSSFLLRHSLRGGQQVVAQVFIPGPTQAIEGIWEENQQMEDIPLGLSHSISLCLSNKMKNQI